MNRLAIVVPCYNEEEVLDITTTELTKVITKLIESDKISKDSFVLYVDDGSRDATWSIIDKHHKQNPLIYGLKLAGNVGHQYALLAGLMAASDLSDVTISIDADLQDDLNVIEEMVDLFHSGKDIVYGVRNDRKKDSFFKRTTAQGFYKLMSFMGVKSVYNHADFRLMSKRAVKQLGEFRESNLFLRGMVPLIGYETACVYYERGKRVAGESKYPLKKMFALAWNGITSFSVKPISLISFLGAMMIVLSILAGIYGIISYALGRAVPGWTSLILSIWFIGGVQLVAIGLIGQYIGKIYMEVKQRPRYNIETLLVHSSEAKQ